MQCISVWYLRRDALTQKYVLWIRLVLPSGLIIINDVFAYVFGFFFGRTPLIKLSPKKTWEGFVGGAFATIVFGLFVSLLFSSPLPAFLLRFTAVLIHSSSHSSRCAHLFHFLPFSSKHFWILPLRKTSKGKEEVKDNWRYLSFPYG